MNIILTKPYKIGSRTHPKGSIIDIESNTAKRMIKNKEAKEPNFFQKKKVEKKDALERKAINDNINK